MFLGGFFFIRDSCSFFKFTCQIANPKKRQIIQPSARLPTHQINTGDKKEKTALKPEACVHAILCYSKNTPAKERVLFQLHAGFSHLDTQWLCIQKENSIPFIIRFDLIMSSHFCFILQWVKYSDIFQKLLLVYKVWFAGLLILTSCGYSGAQWTCLLLRRQNGRLKPRNGFA